MILEDKFNALIKEFVSCKVDFMIVGGYAVNFHGYQRSTSDLDVWVKPDEANKDKICRALINLEYKKENVEVIRSIDFTKHFLFQVGDKPYDIEIFSHITGVDYNEADKNKVVFSLPGETPVFFIGLKDLIVNKMLTKDRSKDKVDVEELQKINLHSKDKSIIDMIKKFFGKKIS